VLDDTLAGVLDRYPELATVACVPLGVSRASRSPGLRPHTAAEAAAVCDAVDSWQGTFLAALGRRMVFAADEYYLMAGRPFPGAATYEGFPQHENGIGMAPAFAAAFEGDAAAAFGVRPGFFAAVDGAPAAGYRAPRAHGDQNPGAASRVTILTSTYGAAVLEPLVASLARSDIRVLPVANRFFGGNIGVAGLLTGTDLAEVLGAEPEGVRYLLPDACLSEGRFLDDRTLEDLPRAVEVVATDGLSLRRALEADAVGTSRRRERAGVPIAFGATR
jgi:NifB/MoaA-like Fe-S oxidoreductase